MAAANVRRGMRVRALLCIAGLALAGCELVNETVLFPVDGIHHELAVSMSGDVAWLARESGEVVAHEVDTGNVLGQVGPWSGSNNVRHVYKAYDTGFEDDVWVLHSSGWRTRWNPSGSFSAFEAPVPASEFPADSRTYCQLARDLDGASYITTLDRVDDVVTVYLYRHQGGQWSRTVAGAAGCGHMDYDVAMDEVAFLDYVPGEPHPIVHWYDADTLELDHEVALVGGSQTNHFVSFNRSTALGTFVFDPQGQDVGGATVFGVGGVDVYYGDNKVQLWWQGAVVPGEPVVGRHDLQ